MYGINVKDKLMRNLQEYPITTTDILASLAALTIQCSKQNSIGNVHPVSLCLLNKYISEHLDELGTFLIDNKVVK